MRGAPHRAARGVRVVRIAVIADVHGNLPALDAVLADVARRGVPHVVDLGDCVSGPLFPRETADRLLSLRLPTVRGNHERQLLTLDPGRMGAADAHAASTLRPEHRAWMAALPATRRVFGDVLLVHGTPGSDLEYFLHTVTADGLREATDDEVAERAGSADAGVILCGHSHLPRAVRLADGRLVVNPGSVGLQAFADDHRFPHRAETGSPHARYAIVERRDDGWTAQPIVVSYDWERAATAAELRGRVDWARALRTGRA